MQWMNKGPRCCLPALLALGGLAACGGGGGGSDAGVGAGLSGGASDDITNYVSTVPPEAPTTQRDAVRLADQATFGATETLVAQIKTSGATRWVAQQMPMRQSGYSSGGTAAVHQTGNTQPYCDQPAYDSPTCWRDNISTEPLLSDFYRNAITQPDQLRQRVAFALQQILVVGGMEANGTYGYRDYHNALLSQALGNYRQLLKKATLSPVMGDYLNNVNNDKGAPNENYARELLQLFTIGTCELNLDGTLKGSACVPTYTNDVVRNYAFALTGWTYPAGARPTQHGCWPQGANCMFYQGDMVPVERYHDTASRPLLSGVTLAAGHTTSAALERVLDSLMAHPNIGPFVGKQLIQHLVTSNPSPAYVARVATAFNTGQFDVFGTGQRGDMAATVAAVLLSPEARGDGSPGLRGGKLREPAQMFTGVLRALNGRTDGDALSWRWGGSLQQHVFRPPSVFNFYPPDYPVPGADEREKLVGPTFGIHNVNTAMQRLNFLNYLIDWNGSNPDPQVPNAVGTKVDLSDFMRDAPDATKLVDRMSLLLLGEALPPASRTGVINAVSAWTSTNDRDWQSWRVKTAAYLVLASPRYQVQR